MVLVKISFIIFIIPIFLRCFDFYLFARLRTFFAIFVNFLIHPQSSQKDVSFLDDFYHARVAKAARFTKEFIWPIMFYVENLILEYLVSTVHGVQARHR